MIVDALYQVSLPVVFWALPFLLGWVAWHLWRSYTTSLFLNSLETVLLEIKIPKELLKTPQAMELALNALHQGWTGDTPFKIWWYGQAQSWFTLEIASFGGEIHFYIWTQKFHQNFVEAQFYAHYPDIEIHEVEDYVHDVPYGLPDSDWKLWGVEFKLSKEDAYPIKTYINYGLDKISSDQESDAWRTDPITSVLEYLGTMKPGEHLWVQIPVIAARGDWKDQGQALVKKLMEGGKQGDDEAGFTILSPGQRAVLENVERSLTKPGFDCGLRAVYLARPELYNANRIVGTLGMLKQFSANDANGFKTALTTSDKYPWSAFFRGYSLAQFKAKMFDAYRRRSYFYPPYVGKSFVLSSEELATVFHFPGAAAMTPSLNKISSKRAEPPSNLPV